MEAKERKAWLRRAVVIAFGVIVMVMGVRWMHGPVTYTASDFDIETYKSPFDCDEDGADDQSDVLASARAYVAQNPHYESAYYATGRPDDGRGVCTDVVDRALLGAGYDLQALIDEDMRASPDAYGVGTIDSNIDFRRVANQRVWFERHAKSLTIDPSEAEQWQGGDIVCWKDHIGVVSDLRNRYGVALVIHHANPLQLRYEEDVLGNTSWGPIVGHWRMG